MKRNETESSKEEKKSEKIMSIDIWISLSLYISYSATIEGSFELGR